MLFWILAHHKVGSMNKPCVPNREAVKIKVKILYQVIVIHTTSIQHQPVQLKSHILRLTKMIIKQAQLQER